MNGKHYKTFLTFLAITLIFSSCSSIKYSAKNQMDLHEKLSQNNMKVAVLPFTLNTPLKDKNIAFESVDVELTNKFTEIIWKKNKVRIAHNNEVIEALKEINISYNELNPYMEDLQFKPNIAKLIDLGKKLGVNVLFTGTVRRNKFDYEGGCCLMPNLFASKRNYNIGAQMMAIDIDKGETLAFDFIKNKLAVKTKFFSFTGEVSDKAFAEGKSKLLEKCGFALAYYAPMPEKRPGEKELKTAVAVLNFIYNTEFSIDLSIKDDTWKLYPEGYFMENFGYTREDFEIFQKNKRVNIEHN